MHVLRTGGEYLAGRERRLWWLLLSTGVIVIGLSLAAGLVLETWLTVLGGGFVVLAIRRIAWTRLQRVRKGRLGERLIANLLRQLSDDYYLVNDVTLPDRRGNIDHVVVGPCGVVVIETIRIAGRIRCDGDAWYVNGRRRASISSRVDAAAAAVRRFLGERHPEIADRFVQSVTVFTHPLCVLDVYRARATVVRYSELLQVLRYMGQSHRMAPRVAERLATTLARSQR